MVLNSIKVSSFCNQTGDIAAVRVILYLVSTSAQPLWTRSQHSASFSCVVSA